MRRALMLWPVAVAVAAAGCRKNAEPAQAGPPGDMPPPEVTVVTVHAEEVALATELAGRTTASLASEVRPRITGIVKQRAFDEGARVTAGQVLYVIEPAQYRAAYESAAADLASAKATLEAATHKHERFAELVKIEGVSKQEADDARLAREQAAANVAQKTAALELARINLDYTTIRAPITGTIGKSSVTAGALVTADQPTPLATIRALDPIYVDLVESSEQRLKLRAQLGSGALSAGSTKVKLVLPDGSRYDRDGVLQFAEVAVDEATGTVTLRAKFPNPDGTLLPGMYVRAQLDEAVAQRAILAPQQAVMRDPKGAASAFVVGTDGKVAARELVATRSIGDRWLVERGLADGDRVIVEGTNKVGPGMPVKAIERGDGAGSAAGSAEAK